MRFCVYQGIPTLINSSYKNRGHAQVVGTNLKQRRMYNLTMSCRRVLLDTLRHFLNYVKIITSRMHARGSNDVDKKTSDERNRKNWEQDKWSNYSYLSTPAVIPRSEKEGTKPPYVCPGCSNHTHGTI
jgi:hypothetical protein